jgi:hypothetical protein
MKGYIKRVWIFLRLVVSFCGEIVLNTIVLYLSSVFFLIMMLHEAFVGRTHYYWKERFTHYINLITNFPDYLAFKLKNASMQLSSFFNTNKS